jgi:hypothetical protein
VYNGHYTGAPHDAEAVGMNLDVRLIAKRSIGCCHKRVGDSTGDESGQFAGLRSFPKESEIAKNAAI